jgi:hypothetical protein
MINSAKEFLKLRDSEDKSEYDRSAIDEAPLSVWYEVIDNHPEYGKWVAHNKTVPLEILERLAQSDDITRQFVARKRKLSQSLFEQLADDNCSTVRIAIAANRKTPMHILQKLLFDEDASVASAANHNFLRRQRPDGR